MQDDSALTREQVENKWNTSVTNEGWFASLIVAKDFSHQETMQADPTDDKSTSQPWAAPQSETEDTLTEQEMIED
jgi:hypothetical protein